MRYLELVGAYAEEFAAHCKTLPSLVCSDCGSDNVEIINLEIKGGVCFDKGCVSYRCPVVLSPSLEVIYGEAGNTVAEGGTGEMAGGKQSASGKMWELHRACPKGGRGGEPIYPGIHECSLVVEGKPWLRDPVW